MFVPRHSFIFSLSQKDAVSKIRQSKYITRKGREKLFKIGKVDVNNEKWKIERIKQIGERTQIENKKTLEIECFLKEISVKILLHMQRWGKKLNYF